MVTSRAMWLCFSVVATLLVVDVLLTVMQRQAKGKAAVTIMEGFMPTSFVKRELKEAEVPRSMHGEHRRQKMDKYLRQRTEQCDEGRGWQSVDMARNGMFNTYLFGDRFVKPELGYIDPDDERYVSFSTCGVEEEGSNGESGWQIYRFGPFVGVGGSDWHQVWIHPLPPPEKAKFITGKMAAPVDEHGTILGHPPIYSHHVHIELNGVQHSLEAHGDTTCSEEHGGTSCYLRSYPEGHGLPFNSTGNDDYFSLDFMLNDLREYPAPPMVFYQEVALKWSSREDVKPMSTITSHMSYGGESDPGHPFSTTLVTKRPSFLWSTSKWLVDGKVIVSQKDQMPWFHAHRKFCQGAWIFAASPEELGLTRDLLQKVDDNTNQYQPTGFNDLVWNPEGNNPVKALIERVENSKAGMESLKCWLMGSEAEKVLEYVNGTDASSDYPESWQQNWRESWYDRAGELHCDPWSFGKGDSYTVVTLNGLDERIPSDDLGIFTQHGAILIPYESTGPDPGPVTTELYAPYSTDLQYHYSIAHNWEPTDFKSAVPERLRSPETLRQRINLMHHYFKEELGHPNVTLSMRDPSRLASRYRRKKHTIWDEAEEAVAEQPKA